MSGHAPSSATHTVEMTQVAELNAHLAAQRSATGDGSAITAGALGLEGTPVHAAVIDRGAAELVPHQQRHDSSTVPGAAQLSRILAVGDPDYPYLYGVFAEGRRELPVPLHTAQLQSISSALRLRHHRWGV